jgi:hypothetical protein
MFDVMKNAVATYTKYTSMIIFFSIPFIIALLMPTFSPAPVFSALGGYFLRSGSIPELSNADILLIIAVSAISLALLSLALVAVNLVVKASRTRTKVSAEALRNLGKYTLTVFGIFAFVKVVETLLLMYTASSSLPELPVFILSFIASLGLFYAAPAVVLEEKKPAPAVISSFKHVFRKPLDFILWLVVAFILLAAASSLSFTMFADTGMRQGFTIIVNSLFILPFLVVLQAHIYLMKYTIVR